MDKSTYLEKVFVCDAAVQTKEAVQFKRKSVHWKTVMTGNATRFQGALGRTVVSGMACQTDKIKTHNKYTQYNRNDRRAPKLRTIQANPSRHHTRKYIPTPINLLKKREQEKNETANKKFKSEPTNINEAFEAAFNTFKREINQWEKQEEAKTNCQTNKPQIIEDLLLTDSDMDAWLDEIIKLT